MCVFVCYMLALICWQIFTSQWMSNQFIHPSIHSFGCPCIHCLCLSFNKAEKGILITNYLNSIDPHTDWRTFVQCTKECSFEQERWLIVVAECCMLCEVWCLPARMVLKLNLFRQQFYLNVQNCRTLSRATFAIHYNRSNSHWSQSSSISLRKETSSAFVPFTLFVRQCLHFSDANRILYWKLLFNSLSISHSINSSAVTFNECMAMFPWPYESIHSFSNRIYCSHTDWLMSFKRLFTIEFIYIFYIFESFDISKY